MIATATTTFRILVIDDHPIVRQGYVQLISNQPDLEVCGFAGTQQEALEQFAQTKPHMAIVDISLREGHGIELIRQASERFPHVKMLVVSGHDEQLFAERALEAGAQGYLNKQEAPEKLIDGIRAVLHGELYVSEPISQRIMKRSVAGKKTAVPIGSVEQLTNREIAVFELIGDGLGTRQIASKLELSTKTIERYKENIKSKLRLANSTELVQRATQWRLESR